MYTLQNFLFPATGAPRSLYLQDNCDHRFAQSDADQNYKLSRGEFFSANTYFNSFYLQYWREYTKIGKIGLELTYSGEISFKLTGEDENGNTKILSNSICKSEDPKGTLTTTHVWFWDLKNEIETNFLPARVYLDVMSLEDSQIGQLRYVTDQPPRKEVSLSIGLCTFNREESLAVTLAELNAFKQTTPELKDIFIVNQGEPFTNSDLMELTQRPDFHLVEQGNFGGCGGFNRTMIDAVSKPDPATYHLLMDDDIKLDARVITRSLQFLSFATSDVAIGGQMLELHRPSILHEAGAKLNFFWLLMSIGKGKNLANAGSLALFNTCYDIDYNAWWYCMIPTSAISKVEFSPPLFIHGDDTEYGCRLKKHGCPTVPLPGVGVWHESFTYKNNDWIQYYDLRNRLVNSAMHSEFSAQPDALYIAGALMHFVLIHRYRAASVCIRAVEEFLAGPERAFRADPATTHQRLIDYTNSLPSPENRTQSKPVDFQLASAAEIPHTSYAVIKLFTANFLRLSLFNNKNREPLYFHGWVHPKVVGTAPYYLANNTSGDQYLYLEPKRLQLWWTTLKALSVAVRYGLQRRAVSRKWLKKLPALQSSEAWQKIFTSGNAN